MVVYIYMSPNDDILKGWNPFKGACVYPIPILVMVTVCARPTLLTQGGGGVISMVANKYKHSSPQPSCIFMCVSVRLVMVW